MSAAEVARFLAEPLVACLATNRADGFPHLSPVWFLFEDEVAFFELAQTRIHLANLRRAVADYGDRIDRRYLGSGWDDPALAEATEPERYTLVRLSPLACVSWDFRHGRRA
jgi:pyridoxamine 5'-phosphate oxidase-like protein